MVIGAGASSVVDNAVAIGSGSAATLSIVAAQAAYTGVTIGSVVYTEGTDATGGEMNVGNRLLTGVADGRIAVGSSDAVNGHQLYTATNELQNSIAGVTTTVNNNAAAVAANTAGILVNAIDITGNTTNISANTSAIGVNTTAIATNASGIATNTAAIGTNTTAIGANTAAIDGINVTVGGFDGRITANETDINENTAAIGTNTTTIGENTTAITSNTAGVSTNAKSIATNGQAITNNSMAIVMNSGAITENRGLIEQNYALGLSNQAAIGDLSQGLAAVASLPDMYLSPKAKWSASGGVGFYGNDTGVGATLAIRGNENWAMGGSFATGGGQSTGKLQVRYEGF